MTRGASVLLGGAMALGLSLGAAAEDGVSAPFMSVELKMAPFQGADEAQTRKRAEAFLAATGYKTLSYQDNEAIRAVDVYLTPAPDGALAKIQHRFERMKTLRALRAQPNVSEVRDDEGERATIYLKPYIYRPQAEGLRAVLPSGAKISYYLNPAMKGLWVDLDVTGLKDARSAAGEFARRYPDQVASADIKVRVEVMRVKTR